ncbi:methyltransferase domain-containing protein [Aromatoleum bremense]|uniref:Methyltransferase domain-containing protein n=1 Tax=Aromatoleum bremense TaxID=76115 RepID=A0ABX1NZG0_9RHOO|nr:methyltransferase domain-containing protein [Aromatoleum bremense]NMG17439.1 methyltransferase domain-containing protein [Aromatoleum bremense]QTQ32565.1 SAM-dependent methyltransferase [Aromatoleum bremense]
MSAPDFDARRFKSIERAGFNRIAARYADGAHLRADLADALLDAARLAPGRLVLDLASGPGLLARAAARQVQPGGWVLASDIAEEMLAEGARRTLGEIAAAAPSAGAPALSFAAADAEQLCLPDASFDCVLAGLALFMFPHPERALTEMHRVLRPGGRVALSTWGARDDVPLIRCAQDCIARLLPAPKVARPSVFRFGDAAVLEAALAAAGFVDVHIEPCRFTCHFADAAAYWQAFLDLAGGAAEALARLPQATQHALRDAIAAELEAHRSIGGTGYSIGALALVATAQRPAEGTLGGQCATSGG